jgi:small subunit ribosomal protein S6
MAASQAAQALRQREYETIYLMRPDVTKESAGKIAARIEDVVKRDGGQLTLVETWGRRQLSYSVRRCRRAVYVYFKYIGGSGLVSELERNLRMMDDIIKFQSVMINPEVDLAELKIDPETVQFEALDLPEDVEDEKALERALGFIEPQKHARGADAYTDDDIENISDDDIPDLNNTKDGGQ